MVDRCKLPHAIFAVHSHGRDEEGRRYAVSVSFVCILA